MARILVSLGSLAVFGLDLHAGDVTVGRAADNDVVLPLPDVSESHARLICRGDAVELEARRDEVVLVNGHLVESASLSPWDVVMIGPYTLRLSQADGPPRGVCGSVETYPEQSRPVLPVHRLQVIAGPDLGTDLLLNGVTTLIGRGRDCNLPLSDPRASWHHAVIERLADSTVLRDLGSRNGTFIDGQQVTVAPVAAGMQITIGQTTLLLCGADAAGVGSEQSKETGLAELIGSSPAMQTVYQQLRNAAASKLPVLLLGETGTGKELAARAIHVVGPRASKAFVPVNCAAIPRDLIETELFGHVRGSFTGAVADHAGAFERADGGTLFLDEIGELALDVQPKLLRALEQGEIARVGDRATSRSDARVIAASNRDLDREASARSFRQDLYFRLAVLTIRLPPLRERREDLPELIQAFIGSAGRDTGFVTARPSRLAKSALEPLLAHDWPGNVRELRNVVHRAILRADGGTITRAIVEQLLLESSPGRISAGGTLEEVERDAIGRCLHDVGNNRRAAARRLGIALSTLYEKIRRYKLDVPPDPRA